MSSLLQFGARTCKNVVKATNLADGRFLYRNSSPRDAGKYIPVYYGEMRHSQKTLQENLRRGIKLGQGEKAEAGGQGVGSREKEAERTEERVGRREGRGGLREVGGRQER